MLLDWMSVEVFSADVGKGKCVVKYSDGKEQHSVLQLVGYGWGDSEYGGYGVDNCRYVWVCIVFSHECVSLATTGTAVSIGMEDVTVVCDNIEVRNVRSVSFILL